MVPELTYEERIAALGRAKEARRMRHSIKAAIKAGTLDPARALAMEDARGMRVRDFLRAVPGVGKCRADEVMRRLGISQGRRVRGVGCRQMERLLDWIENREH